MPSAPSCLLGIDVGTSSTKAILLDEHARVIASHAADHPIHRPHPGWSEQDPEDWWRSTREAIAAVRAASPAGHTIRAIGLSGQMHGSVFLDKTARSSNGSARALRHALLWNDQRTAAQCDHIEHALGSRRALVELSGNAALTGFTLPKVLWLREHEPEVFARVAHVLMPKDFIRFRLTGEIATDVGDASGTLAFDVDARRWGTRVLNAVGLDPALFPTSLESCAIAGTLSAAAAEQTGLSAGIPVVAGSGDNMCGGVGAGIVEPGMVLATLGTSGVIYAHSERPRRDLPTDASTPISLRDGGTGVPPVPNGPGVTHRRDACATDSAVTNTPAGRLHTMCAGDGTAAAPGSWCITGCMLSAAGALHWVRDTIAPHTDFDTLLAEAAAAPPGCDGLIFLPYLTGERCPHPDPAARAGWIGLTARHSRAHLVRATLEGVAFGMGDILDLVRSIGVPVATIRIGGGGARSTLWRQILADVFRAPIISTNTDDGPALGAALMAGVGINHWPSIAHACRDVIRETATLHPNAVDPRLTAARTAFAQTYGALQPITQQLTAISRITT
jgi:xylulokinase